ncbi:hypothetical protein AWJ20_2691 [Sugiyamaella lignohabitans]|uniref:Uncharacterized protein n=1 Tax=Sugiyamaella lignohabitans TaxID=796027 RepID=A0A167FBH5_9ASCO|nr:uncharacterized protein AWJ20_2691 [Sugiyamaella lignohabitans]ANB15071.1 hypothetical protein AWJ20_2691 [Sugiyamaella lignohabitans]
MFGFAEAIRVSGNSKIDRYLIIGLIMTGITPTTVSSNVVMTKQAHGNDSLSIIEVTIGNLLGAFISPALAQLYLSSATGFAYGNPASDGSLTQLYARVMKQLGLGLFVPLFVGQIVQNIFPEQVKYAMTTFKLAKLGSLCMLSLIWSTFSTAFYEHAFEIVSKESIIMVVFLNVGCYLLFTVLCFGMARMPLHKWISPPTETASIAYKLWHRCLVGFHFDRRDTVAIMLCGAAKTVALGIPLIQAQYGTGSTLVGRVSIPLVLYQGEQILTAQLLIPLMKRWVDADPELKKSDDIISPNIEPPQPESFEVKDNETTTQTI